MYNIPHSLHVQHSSTWGEKKEKKIPWILPKGELVWCNRPDCIKWLQHYIQFSEIPMVKLTRTTCLPLSLITDCQIKPGRKKYTWTFCLNNLFCSPFLPSNADICWRTDSFYTIMIRKLCHTGEWLFRSEVGVEGIQVTDPVQNSPDMCLSKPKANYAVIKVNPLIRMVYYHG